VFLSKPLSEVARHMEWTSRLIDAINAESEWQNRG